ncbi:MAG: hypothetical protein AMXMBFR53_43600 [Gemmatimonadota bacterium]
MGEMPLRSSRAAWWAFDRVLRPWMSRHVRVHVTGRPGLLEPGFPLLLVANHESFWDGFLLREVQRRLRPRGRFHAVMLERELKERPLLRWLGGLGVTPGSVASARGLLRTMERLRRDDPTGVIAYFPQGAIHPGAFGPLRFRSGVARVAGALAPATVLPVGIRVLPGRSHRQEAYVSVGEALAVPSPGTLSTGLVEAAVAEELAAIRAFLAAWGERSPERWPALPGRLPRASHSNTLLRDVRGWISRN